MKKPPPLPGSPGERHRVTFVRSFFSDAEFAPFGLTLRLGKLERRCRERKTLEFYRAIHSRPTTSIKTILTKARRLGSYLTITVGAGTLAGTAQAAIVNLDIGPLGLDIGGVNAGLDDAFKTVAFPTGGLLELYFDAGNKGLDGEAGLRLAVDGGYVSPRKFGGGETIGSQIFNWSELADYTLFTYNSHTASDFGPGSFMGFKTADGNYGWLEVTWDAAALEFEILSGAYEDVAGVGIEVGAVAAVPEPASVLGTIGLLSAGIFVRRRKVAA